MWHGRPVRGFPTQFGGKAVIATLDVIIAKIAWILAFFGKTENQEVFDRQTFSCGAFSPLNNGLAR